MYIAQHEIILIPGVYEVTILEDTTMVLNDERYLSCFQEIKEINSKLLKRLKPSLRASGGSPLTFFILGKGVGNVTVKIGEKNYSLSKNNDRYFDFKDICDLRDFVIQLSKSDFEERVTI